MTTVGQVLYLGSRDVVSQNATVLRRYQEISVCGENEGRGSNISQTVTGIEAADCLELSLQGIVWLNGSLELPFPVALQ